MNSEPPDGYLRCIEDMQRAARVWLKQHPFAEPRFAPIEEEFARAVGKPGERPAIVALLSDVIDRWAANEDARSFLRALDEGSGGEGTYQMARALIAQATANALERSQGRLSAGDWRCTGCGQLNDGFTRFDGSSVTPTPGALTVCAYCGALQQINAAGNTYEALSTRELNRLPKSLRMQLLAMKAEIEKRRAREGQRS